MSPSARILALVSLVAAITPFSEAFAFSSPAGRPTRHADPATQNHHSSCTGSTRSTRSTRTRMMMAAGKKNRRERRFSDGKQKKASANRSSGPTSDAKWLQVLDETPEMETGSVKVVSGKYKGEDKFFTLTTHAGEFYAVSEACGRCKFPLINGKVKLLTGEGKVEDVKDGAEQDPDAEVGIGCPLCGAAFNLRTGAIAGEKPEGLAQLLVSKVVSQTPVESITTYQAQALSSGAIVVRVD
ncbi:unnamed protein product [Scytosiphon promiscuus]